MSTEHPKVVLYKVEASSGMTAGVPAFVVQRIVLERLPKTYRLVEGRGMGYRSLFRPRDIELNFFRIWPSIEKARAKYHEQLESDVVSARRMLEHAEEKLAKYKEELAKGNVNEPPPRTGVTTNAS
jgi:hypothetical protein